MIERFQYYVDENLVRKGTPNRSEAKALMERAAARFNYIDSQKITDATAPFIFEDVYEVLREAAQALMELKGYKPYSHESVISFLNEFFDIPQHDISSFNRYRMLRNKALYRAEKITADTCKVAFDFMKHFFPILREEFEKLCKQ